MSGKTKHNRLLFASIVIAIIIVGGGIGGYLWYSRGPADSDGDGIEDVDDAFPDDPAASIDSDGDGRPDKWNPGKNETDSTSIPKLHLDAFPDDPDEWNDTDGDGYGDNEADTFPNDPYEWTDSDGDGFGDNSDIAPQDNTRPNINDPNFEWVNISPGAFWMGSYDNEGLDREHPRHNVTITKGFQMLKFEVTQTQWNEVMGSNPSIHSGDNNPVETVSWNDCQSFISRLNRLDLGHIYRLPTEAEWEYTCRAGSNTLYCYGNGSGQLEDYAWYEDNSNERTHRVGQKKPNAWGLYDMHGNVWEWCQDWYDKDYYEISPNKDPQGTNSGSSRVLRGGSWLNDAEICRSASRHGKFPIFKIYELGLRLVRE